MPEARIPRIESGKRVTAAQDVLYYGNNMQLVSCVRMYEEFEKRGARTAGISIDLPEHNEAMIKKHAPSFPTLGRPQRRPR